MATKKKRKKKVDGKKFKSEWALVKSFVCMLGDYLTDDCGLSPSLAMHKAWMTERLLEHLGQRKVSFMYRKEKDGSVRKAVGTLNPEECTELKEWLENREASQEENNGKKKEKKKKSECLDCFIYWDVEEKDWRSFKAENLIWYDEDDE